MKDMIADMESLLGQSTLSGPDGRRGFLKVALGHGFCRGRDAGGGAKRHQDRWRGPHFRHRHGQGRRPGCACLRFPARRQDRPAGSAGDFRDLRRARAYRRHGAPLCQAGLPGAGARPVRASGRRHQGGQHTRTDEKHRRQDARCAGDERPGRHRRLGQDRMAATPRAWALPVFAGVGASPGCMRRTIRP